MQDGCQRTGLELTQANARLRDVGDVDLTVAVSGRAKSSAGAVTARDWKMSSPILKASEILSRGAQGVPAPHSRGRPRQALRTN